ncbi:winged helix-turn-helix transcriptional regulator [Streptomyces hydrogenans]
MVPPKTVYSLTGRGLALSLVLAPLSDWGHGHLDRLAAARTVAS